MLVVSLAFVIWWIWSDVPQVFQARGLFSYFCPLTKDSNHSSHAQRHFFSARCVELENVFVPAQPCVYLQPAWTWTIFLLKSVGKDWCWQQCHLVTGDSLQFGNYWIMLLFFPQKTDWLIRFAGLSSAQCFCVMRGGWARGEQSIIPLPTNLTVNCTSCAC